MEGNVFSQVYQSFPSHDALVIYPMMHRDNPKIPVPAPPCRAAHSPARSAVKRLMRQENGVCLLLEGCLFQERGSADILSAKRSENSGPERNPSHTGISGGFRISQRECQPWRLVPTYYLVNFSQKLHENKEILFRGGGHVPRAL